MESLILRAYPWYSGILTHPNLTTVFHSETNWHSVRPAFHKYKADLVYLYRTGPKFITQLLLFEDKIFTSFSHDALAARQLLCMGKNISKDVDITSRSHMHQMFQMFIPYRVLDLLALVEGIPGLVVAPKQIKMANLGLTDKTVCFNHQ